MCYMPPEFDIQRVMRDLGFERMQAINHLRCLYIVRNILRNKS